jgi:formylglycine-generating enzyme required for sulfatase activity
MGCICGEPDCGTCPVTAQVSRSTYRIDATETTNAEYMAFLSSVPLTSSQPSVCSWNWTFEPTDIWPVVAEPNRPVANVDWCDAFAYCAWAGKRLCGAKGGGAALYTSYENKDKNEWFAACSDEGSHTYPYGSTYNAMACNGGDYAMATFGDNQSSDVGSLTSCEVTGLGIFDMSGNVYEWENSCATWDGGLDVCHTRGGSFYTTNSALLQCRTASISYKRSFTRSYIGIRCCDDL